MVHALPIKLISLFLIFISLLWWVRVENKNINTDSETLHVWSEDFSPVREKIIAGSMPGLMADFRMLDVFSIFYDARFLGRPEEIKYLNTYLMRAQNLDPKFFDVYRIAGSILAYDANKPKEAVNLLKKGIKERPDTWEFGFYAGFIAYDQLKDEKLAYELLSQVVEREGVPPVVVTLASRFLASSATDQDAIIFLSGLLKVLPEEYRDGIKERLKQLKEGTVRKSF